MSAAARVIDPARDSIVRLYLKNVHGKCPPSKKGSHDGAGGHWLEQQMGIRANGKNEPDLMGYEMKKCGPKISFGDWSADKYIFKKGSEIYQGLTRDQFLRVFGKPNADKGGRFAWSGEAAPKIGQFNSFGQRLFVDDSENIIAEYSFKHDRRPDKEKILPQTLKLEKPVPIAQWSRDKIKKKLEKKFAQKGFFICLQNKDGVFNEIRFGGPLFFDDWIKCVKTGDVFFDPGMYQGNMRPYSQWRAGSNFWMKLLEPV